MEALQLTGLLSLGCFVAMSVFYGENCPSLQTLREKQIAEDQTLL